jgi:predicted acylesterase/phospholipase RssA
MIKNLIISGGATKTISVLGCLRYLEEKSLLKHVDQFIGTSAGSMLCFLLVLGYSVEDCVKLLKDKFIENNLNSLSLDQLFSLNILTTFGMDSGDNIVKVLQYALFTRYQRNDITFLELAKMTGKNLVVCTANITKQQQEYFSVDTHASVSVLLALRISVSLPFIFTPVLYEDCYYVDGGIYENLPVSYINKFRDPIKDTLAIYTVEKSTNSTITSFLEYVTALFGSIVQKANKLETLSAKINLVEIEFDDVQTMSSFSFDTLSFFMSSSMIEDYMEKGYRIIKQYFETQKPLVPPVSVDLHNV